MERQQKIIKGKVKNRACVEGCIAEAELLQELTYFTSGYFSNDVPTVHNPIPRYNPGIISHDSELSLFSTKGDTTSRGLTQHLTREEWSTAMLYILTNLPEVDDYVRYAHLFYLLWKNNHPEALITCSIFSKCRDFIEQEWTKRDEPSRKQKEKMLRKGAKKDS
jgi:hypothetical protein